MNEEKLPEYLKSDASYLQCDLCGRKSYGATKVNSVCDMWGPSVQYEQGEYCTGIMKSSTSRP